MKARHGGRTVALKVLYELDTTQHPLGVVLAQRLTEEPLPPEGEAFARELVTGVWPRREELDRLIHQHAPEWPIEQMAIIDRNVLRIAIFEFYLAHLTPVKVAINEAVELAKAYGSDSAPRFVNGVLGALTEPEASP